MDTSGEGVVVVSVLQGVVVADVSVLRRAARRVARRHFRVNRRLPLQHRSLTLKNGRWFIVQDVCFAELQIALGPSYNEQLNS